MNVELLKAKILDLAIHGKLVPQLDSEPAVEQIGEVPDEIPFEIPEKWKWVRLDNICSYIQRGKSPKYSPIKKYPVIAQKCNQWSGFQIDKAQFIDPETLSSYKQERILCDLDILWNSTGLGTLGRLALYLSQLNPYNFAVADSHVTVIRSNQAISIPHFIFNYLRSSYVQSRIEYQAGGTTKQKELGLTLVKNYPIPCPPLQEQNRIVAKINELFSILDAIDAKQKSLEEKLKLIKSKALDLAIHGKLVPQLDNEPAVEQIGEVPDEIPFEIPEKWKWVKLNSISKIINGDRGSNYPAKSKLSNIKTDHPFVSAANISNCRLDYKKMLYLSTEQISKLRTGFILAGDFLLCIRGSLGKFAYITNDGGAIASSLCIVRFDSNVFFKPFGEILLSSNLLSSFIFSNKNGTAQPNIGASIIKETPISLPPLVEQHRIVAKINEIFSFCDKAMELLHK